MNTGRPSRSDITSRKGMSVSGRLTHITACPSRWSIRQGMPNPIACTSAWCSSNSVAVSTIASTSAFSERPSTSRCTRSCTSSCSSTTPPSSLVPPRSMPMTLRLIRAGGSGHFVNIWGTQRGQGPAPTARIPPGDGRNRPPRHALRQTRIPRLPLPPRVPEPPVRQARRRALGRRAPDEPGKQPQGRLEQAVRPAPGAGRPRRHLRAKSLRPAPFPLRTNRPASPGTSASAGSACSSACCSSFCSGSRSASRSS